MPQLTPQQKQVLKMIFLDSRKFPHDLVTLIPDSLSKAALQLLEAGMIENVAGGYLLTEKGKDVCSWSGLW